MLYWGDRREAVLSEITRIIADESWDDLAPLVDHSFFALSVTDPDVVHDLWQHVPESWLDEHPRYLMSAAIARSGKLGYIAVHADARRRFERWVEQTPHPETRDLLGVLTTRMRQAHAAGQFLRAAQLADEAERLIHTTTETIGFDDVLPSVLLLNGIAFLLTGHLRRAHECFSESWRWSTHVMPHPIAPIAAEHLALCLALMHEFSEARHWLGLARKETPTRHVPSSRYPLTGLLAEGLIAIEHADNEAAGRVLDAIGCRVSDTGFWWLEVHLRARAALHRGVAGPAILFVERELSSHARLAGPESAAGMLLRADLADLYQLVGNLPASHRILEHTGLPAEHPLLATSRARLSLLEGNPRAALERLTREAARDTEAGASLHTRWAVLRASALGQMGSPAAETAIREAAELIRFRSAPSAPGEADPATRRAIQELLRTPPTLSLLAYPYGRSSRLTARENDVLGLLSADATLPEIAAGMHVSINTLKSHLRSLYRKLGVTTREEAVRVARHRAGSGAPETAAPTPVTG